MEHLFAYETNSINFNPGNAALLDVTVPLNHNTFVVTFIVSTAFALSEGYRIFLCEDAKYTEILK